MGNSINHSNLVNMEHAIREVYRRLECGDRSIQLNNGQAVLLISAIIGRATGINPLDMTEIDNWFYREACLLLDMPGNDEQPSVKEDTSDDCEQCGWRKQILIDGMCPDCISMDEQLMIHGVCRGCLGMSNHLNERTGACPSCHAIISAGV